MKSGILVSSVDLRPSLMSILKGLDEAGLLKQVITTVAIDPDSIFGKGIKAICGVLPSNYRRGIDRRFLPDFLKGKTQTLYSRELIRLLLNRLEGGIFTHRVWLWAELGFDRKVASRYSGIFSCIYGMEHSSLETFTRQKKQGGLCILRQVTAHGRTIANVIRRETKRFPEYTGPYLRLFLEDIERSLARKEAEYQLADLIVGNSSFVKETFVQAGVAHEKIVVIPTGCPPCSKIPGNAGRGNKPLIFLFVGRQLLRKGIPYLLKAWHLLRPGRNAELWLVGSNEIPNTIFKKQEGGIRYFGVLSQSNLARIYSQADVFVLPTLLEGLAYVVLEALSYGLPIITTQESGCGNFVQNGHNGFVIESANPESLCNAMAWCLGHRHQLQGMGEASMEKAARWTVADSNSAHLMEIQKFLENKGIK
ncbi:MAG: glycosyltransferase family 4 protein [Candidatus Omnitrophota bacterium]|nr:glycosyltransferase family 4 protein [Candidatus Omnitrophota bacterium]